MRSRDYPDRDRDHEDHSRVDDRYYRDYPTERDYRDRERDGRDYRERDTRDRSGAYRERDYYERPREFERERDRSPYRSREYPSPLHRDAPVREERPFVAAPRPEFRDPVAAPIPDDPPVYEENNQLYITNLAPHVTLEDVYSVFASFGRVMEHHANPTRHDPRSIASAFIHFETFDGAWHALKNLRGTMGTFKNRRGDRDYLARNQSGLIVKYAHPMKSDRSQVREDRDRDRRPL